jgi:hypothetical protein
MGAAEVDEGTGVTRTIFSVVQPATNRAIHAAIAMNAADFMEPKD